VRSPRWSTLTGEIVSTLSLALSEFLPPQLPYRYGLLKKYAIQKFSFLTGEIILERSGLVLLLPSVLPRPSFRLPPSSLNNLPLVLR